MTDAGSTGSPADKGRGPVRVHVPVLLPASLEVMDLAPGLTVVDGTVGAGGHSAAFAAGIAPGGTLVGLDRDAEILEHARSTLQDSALWKGGQQGSVGDGSGIVLQHASYTEVKDVLERHGIDGCDRVFLDLGVSSLQIDTADRGFSFLRDGPLDMRMDRERSGKTASEWIRTVGKADLESALRDYGDERYARRIATAIVDARRRYPIERTGQLADLVVQATPGPARHGRIHAATRTFQAVRIAVNDELGQLERGLRLATEALRPGGRLCVISFHSAEDRVVKRYLRENDFDLPTRKPIQAEPGEAATNPRSRSARLRYGIKRAA